MTLLKQQGAVGVKIKGHLGELIDLFGNIRVGNADADSRNVLDCADDYVLTPGRCIGVAVQPKDDEQFQEQTTQLAVEWRGQRAKAMRLDAASSENLRALGFG